MFRVEFLDGASAEEAHGCFELFLEDWVSPVISSFVGYQALDKQAILSNVRSTPAWPPAPKPHSAARPIPTPLAPKQSALTTSVPRLMPPSTRTSTLDSTSGQYFRISRRVWMAGGAVSAALPPWLERMIPLTCGA